MKKKEWKEGKNDLLVISTEENLRIFRVRKFADLYINMTRFVSVYKK